MDPSKRVSQEARRLEIEQTEVLIRENVSAYIRRVFRGSVVQVTYDPLKRGYLVSVGSMTEGKKFVSRGLISDEAIDQNCINVSIWTSFLERFSLGLRETLAGEYRKAGINTVSLSTDTRITTWSDSTTAGNSTMFYNGDYAADRQRMAQRAQEALEAHQREMAEEKLAIESIKKAARGR